MADINNVIEFLDKVKTYYLATDDGGQPRVRPFGTALLYEGSLYIQTGKIKNVSKQLAANPRAEICAFDGAQWIRISGDLVNDESREVKKAMLDKFSGLRSMYSEDDGNTQVLYFKNAAATFYSFTSEPVTVTL